MKTPWMNYKKMQEIISTQKNCICSSKVYRKSLYLEKGEKNFRQIYITNSLGVQIKFINHCLTRQHFKEVAIKNNSLKIAENEPFSESTANSGVDQFHQANQADENLRDVIIIDAPELQKKPVDDSSSESIPKSTHDTNNDSESSNMGEDPKTVNYEEYNQNQNEQSPESFANTEVDQVSKVNPVGETQKEEIIDGPELQTKPIENPSSESIMKSTHDTKNDSESNSMGNDPETDTHEENNENQNEQSPESIANTAVDQFSKVNLVDETKKEEKINDSPEVRINPVNEANSESKTKFVKVTINDFESTISDENPKAFDHEEMYENIQHSFKSCEINNNSLNTPYFINIRVPVVIGEFNLDCCLEEVLTFEKKVTRINEIVNNVVLTNSKFVPTQLSSVLDNGTCKALEAYLCIEGFVDQTIEYISEGTDEFPLNGKLCSLKRKTPFSITCKIDDFLHPPIFGSIAQTTFEFLDQNNIQIPQLDTEQFHSTIYYPEQPYCQIISSKIHESVCLTDTVYASNNHLNQSAVISKKYQFDQKIVVEVFVHLLQIQHVRVKSDDTWS